MPILTFIPVLTNVPILVSVSESRNGNPKTTLGSCDESAELGPKILSITVKDCKGVTVPQLLVEELSRNRDRDSAAATIVDAEGMQSFKWLGPERTKSKFWRFGKRVLAF